MVAILPEMGSSSSKREQRVPLAAISTNVQHHSGAAVSPLSPRAQPSRSKPASPILSTPFSSSTDSDMHHHLPHPSARSSHHHHVGSSSHSRSYSTSSNPRPSGELHLMAAQSYGGVITSRPSSRASSSTSRPTSPVPTGRSGSRSRYRTTVHSPLLYGSADSFAHPNQPEADANADADARGSSTSISSSGSGHFHGRPSPSASHGSSSGLVQLLSRWKASLGIGTGEWHQGPQGRLAVPARLKAYVPLLIWVLVSVAMAAIVGIWHSRVFSFLDSLSVYLKSQGLWGNFLLFLCIFATTFPPLPLYSTFIFLAGYSFGLLEGFIVSYAAALSGAVVVFMLSKTFLRTRMVHMLDCSPGLKKVVRAIERRPKLLFLIRLSPYPYNVMNVLLASSQTLSFSCYFWCTAISLLKLVVHCSVGTTIRSFAESTGSSSSTTGASEEEMEAERAGQRLKATAGAVGVALCIGLFIYLLIVARRAVDDLDDTDRLPSLDSSDSLSLRLSASRSPETAYRHLPDQEEMREVSVHQPEPRPRASAVYHRHTFERQDSSPALGLGAASGGRRVEKMGKFEEEWISGDEEPGSAAGMSGVVAGLERAALGRGSLHL